MVHFGGTEQLSPSVDSAHKREYTAVASSCNDDSIEQEVSACIRAVLAQQNC